MKCDPWLIDAPRGCGAEAAVVHTGRRPMCIQHAAMQLGVLARASPETWIRAARSFDLGVEEFAARLGIAP